MPYTHNNKDPNLNNLHHAMQLRNDGKPELRVNASGITLSGDINVGNVEIANDEGNPIPISGSVTATISGTPTVNIGTIPEVEIKNDTGNPIPISRNTTSNSNTNPIFVQGTSDTSFFAPTQSDAFGRLRISNPVTLFDSFHRYQDNGSYNTSLSGSGSTTYNVNSSSISMTVGTASGDSVIRETRRVFAYQPGKSLLVLTTFTYNAAKTNLRQRGGFFDIQNGIFLEQDGTNVYIVRRSYNTGVAIDTKVARADWSENTLPSLDLTKSQIFWTDIEWLGVGSVRCGFVINGEFIHCHTFHHANIITSTYMTTACLPGRLEITNTGTTASSSTLEQICFTVISEGGYELRGRPRSIGHDLGSPRTVTVGNLYPLYSIRLKSSRLNAIVLPKAFSIAVTGNTNYRYYILSGGVTTGGVWVSAGTDSSVEYNLTATGITGGDVSDVGYIINSNQSSVAPSGVETPFKYQLERNTFTNETFEYTICIETVGNNQSAWASVQWDEIT